MVHSAKLIIVDGEYTASVMLGDSIVYVEIISPVDIKVEYAVLILLTNSKPIIIKIKETKRVNDLMTFAGHIFNPREKTILPVVYDGTYQQYEYPISELILDMFVRTGAATAKMIDKVLLCPQCNTISFTIRPGCPECGSAATRPDQLVHHYSCGNVDFLEAYTIDRKEGKLTCTKCKKGGLILGADYDISVGLQRCMDCGWSGSGIRMIGRCLCCETTFLITEAKEIILKEYTIL